MTELTKRQQKAEADKVVKHVMGLDRSIRQGIEVIRATWISVAACAFEFFEERGWEVVNGPDSSLAEYLADPDIEIGKSEFYRLVQFHRVVVVQRAVAPARLKGLRITKAMEVLPAIASGEVDEGEALADARELGRRDLRAKYVDGRGPNAKIDPSAEPDMARCPTCQSWVEADKIAVAA